MNSQVLVAALEPLSPLSDSQINLLNLGQFIAETEEYLEAYPLTMDAIGDYLAQDPTSKPSTSLWELTSAAVCPSLAPFSL